LGFRANAMERRETKQLLCRLQATLKADAYVTARAAGETWGWTELVSEALAAVREVAVTS
jgi:hypothetical protein